MKKVIPFMLMFAATTIFAQTNYQLPPKEILELADVKTPPQTSISRNNTWLLLLERPLYKTLEELAEPELKLAGLRMNPENFNVSRSSFYTSLTIQKLSDAKPITLKNMPQPLMAQYVQISPNENYCSFVQVNPSKLSLWVIDLKTGEANMILPEGLNATMGSPYQWSNDESFLYCKWKGDKMKLSVKDELPKGPSTQDATGVKAPARTFQDLLRNKQDEAKFDHYAGASVLKVSVDGQKRTPLLPEGIYKMIAFSPDGKYILTEEVVQPYSYALTYFSFSSRFNVYDQNGNPLIKFYNRPLQDKVPINFDAVEAGKRNIYWRSDKPSTLYWCEAPDGGDPAVAADYRDQLWQSDFPFMKSSPVCKLKNRFSGIVFGKDDLAIVTDYWWKNRNTRTCIINPSMENQDPKVIYDLSSEDLYADPGSFVTTYNEYNKPVLQFSKNGKSLFLEGEGYSPDGNRPFIDAFDLNTMKTERLWRADGKTTYESILRVVDVEKKLAITSIESPKIYPNLYLRDYSTEKAPKQITFRENPYKSLMDISKQKIYYKRKDGVDLSATLYLPAGYDKVKNGPLPMLMDAYPLEYKDDKTAGQVKESPFTFISINWASPLFWVNRGYAILQDAEFPIIGKGSEEPNDTYIEQLVADAAAAINTVDSMGVVDKNRCAVMGHSYGAFMTANLLAHSDLFAAGIARSGAYNRTLTPFGFQSEERTYWQAPDVYNKMSPFSYADKIKLPLLLIHGDADNNPGTFTLQSERLFQAIKGNGGKARLVLLPFESHGYAARENILHMLWEMDTWLDKYVKGK
ncbi:MAG: prolyl oligopeptidase family serine peptidase [Bacteroidota bacterium]